MLKLKEIVGYFSDAENQEIGRRYYEQV